MYGRFLICIALSFVIATSGATDKNILFNRLDINDGLYSNEVSCIFKDKKGFMWFGSGAVLIRYDGYEFCTFRHKVGGAYYSENYILRIMETADGHLWITYRDGLISVYNPAVNQFYTVAEISKMLNIPMDIASVFDEGGGRLLFSTNTNSLYLYDFQTQEIQNYAVDHSSKICDARLQGNGLYVVHTSGLIEVIDTKTNNCILKDYTLSIYADTRNYFNLFVDSDRELWIYINPENSNGLFRFSPEANRWSHYTTTSDIPLTSNMIRSVEEDRYGTIWIATDHGGINLLNKQEGEISYLKHNPFDPQSISQNSVICLYKDNTDIIWCGTYKNGINYYHESIFKFESMHYPLYNPADAGINDCNCVHEDSLGNLWIGTNGNGLLYYDRKTGRYRKYKHNPLDSNSLSSDIVVCLTNDADGRLWIGTYTGGLDCFDGKTFVHYKGDINNQNGLSDNSVYSLYADENNILWIGTLDRGLCRFDIAANKWTYFNASGVGENSLLANNIYALARGENSTLLIGTLSGVNFLDMQTNAITAFRGTQDSSYVFNAKTIHAIFNDSRNLLWIGSNDGLYIYDSRNDAVYLFDKTNGLPDNNIMSFLEDDAQVLWIGTKNGLLKIDVQTTENAYEFKCTTYYAEEGVRGRIFNSNSACRTSQGELILGNTDGMTIFNPRQISYNNYPPIAVISGFQLHDERIMPNESVNGRIILNQDISYVDHITLKYNERNLTFHLSALNYFIPQKNTFSYIMEGFDSKWTTIGAGKRSITYTNLQPGNYTFVVNARNNDGVWSDEPTKLYIKILPPAWATVWAIILYIIAGSAIIYGIIHVFVRIQKKKIAKEQEQLETIRLHEMDEMKLRFFTNISHEFRTPLTLIMAPLEKLMNVETNLHNLKLFKLIKSNANQLLMLVNQLLDFRKIDNKGTELSLSTGDIVLFVRNIVYSFKDISDQKNIRLSYSSALPSFSTQFDTDKVFKILSNLLGNAFKFTPDGGEISVVLQVNLLENDKNELLIQVSDNGIGIAPELCELIFNRFYQIIPNGKTDTAAVGTGIGLHLCREFAKIHNGNISVKSTPGKGSTFTLTLPVKSEDMKEVISSPAFSASAETLHQQLAIKDERPVVMIVDDNYEFREFMQQCLNDVYNVIIVADGDEAWRIIQYQLPDLVVSDIMMPVMDGISLCRLIKDDIRTSHIPVILLTAKLSDTNKLIGLEAGADDYIEKPFNMNVLQVRIRRLIELKNKVQHSTKNGIQLTNLNINSVNEKLIKKVIDLTEKQLSDPELSVEWLSREMGMSRANFYKKILSITGKTPVELIRTIRMRHAAQLLEKSQLRINEVAFQVGINDNRLFRKYFKKEFGLLPSKYNEKKNIHLNNL